MAEFMELYLLLMLILPLAGAGINGVFGRRLSHAAVSVVGCGAAGISTIFALLAAWTYSHLGSAPAPFIHHYFTWLNTVEFHADFDLFYDRLALVMTCTVTVVAFLIHLYSRGYMEHEGGYYRFFCYLNLFLFMMLTLVTAANYPLMFVGWEGVGLCSYLLIGFYFRKKSASDAGKKAFITTRIGDVGFTLGIALMFAAFHSVDFVAVFDKAGKLAAGEHQTVITAICLLLFLGAVGKSAQIPLYVWLPDAMEGPTPVSALIHAATMVTAGVYMVARSNLLYAHAPLALAVVGAVGCITALFAATIAVCQNDLKRLLAYSTISQLGYMFLACGAGVFAAGIFHLMTHACFKALLFLAAGSVMHAMSGELDMRQMGGLRNKLPITFWTFLIGTLAISGAPLFSGFFSKDEILAAAYEGPLGASWLYWVGTLTAGLTAFYMFRAVFLTFFGASRVPHQLEPHLHESGSKMTAPLIVLGAFSALAGYLSIPKALGGTEKFDEYLSPVFSSSEQLLRSAAARPESHALGPLALMALALLFALAGFLVAWKLYWRSPAAPKRIAARFGGLYRVLVNKYYVDEFYNWLVVRPVVAGSEKVLWQAVDAGLIDGVMVNGSAHAARGIGGVLRRIQSGNLRSYAAWVLLGAVVWLGYIFFK
jgi:NADH-quinone oxidoreductase subunit L